MTKFYNVDIQHSEHFLFCEKFVNLLMIDGKKTKAYKLFFQTLTFLNKKINHEFEKKTTKQLTQISIFYYLFQAIENVKPNLEVKKVRIAGNTYLVPAILSKNKQEMYAMRWIIQAARKKNSIMSFSQNLAEEIFEAFKKQGHALQKRNEIHRLAEANRAYTRYRWW